MIHTAPLGVNWQTDAVSSQGKFLFREDLETKTKVTVNINTQFLLQGLVVAQEILPNS